MFTQLLFKTVSRRYLLACISQLCILFSCTNNPTLNPNELLRPRDILNPPSLLHSTTEFGHIGQFIATVPASSSIFLADAENDTVLEYEGQQDFAPDNSPVQMLKGVLRGGEILDIYANGNVRHIPRLSIEAGPKGWDMVIIAGPAREIDQVQGRICALVGLFDNQEQPFIVGQRKQIRVPRGARSLYLGVLDFPGASSNNQGEFQVSIDVIRR